jgi:hypothetical protein
VFRTPLYPYVLSTVLLFALPASAQVTIGGAGLSVTVDPAGTYSVSSTTLAWHFTGHLTPPLLNVTVVPGADTLGNYNEITFDFQAGVRHAAIRSYADRPAILFTLTAFAPTTNTVSFPSFNDFPRNLDHLSYSGIFAPPSFSNLAAESPWVFFDASYNTFILSAADHFMTAAANWGPAGELANGIASTITSLPQGFRQRALLVIESGVNRAFDTWGQTLIGLGGKTPPANDADTSLNQVGYWTDNGATYYYQTAPSMNYEQTFSALKSDFDRAGIGLGYIQLDSWFYPKGPGALWSNNGEGIYEYRAAAPPFMSGLASFQRRIGLPLVTHARWIDSSSPYRKTYQMSGNVVIDPAYWNTVATYLATSGVTTYEQDWLADKAQTDFNLTDGEAFLDNMASAMAQRNLTMQYCMASPRHFLQSSRYSNLTTIRTSADRLGRDRWTDFLYTSRLASALGVWPFTDNFNSTETTHLLIATLSAGPVGLGDAVGALNAANLLRAVRRDGVIVKPDVPLTPIDSSYSAMAHGTDTPQINAAYTASGALQTYYIFAYSQGKNLQASFSPSDFGASSRVYLYDYFAGTGELVEAADAIQRPITGDSLYLIAAPIGPSGIAVVGDTGQFVSMGKKRIPVMRDDGIVHLTVAFAPNETARTVTGYSPARPIVHALDGTIQGVAYDAGTHQFSLTIAPGPGSQASIQIRPHRSVGLPAYTANEARSRTALRSLR